MITQPDTALVARILALADDELILAHRNSEWTGHAPILEEDIGLANIAQDELGHATLWYERYAALTGADPDQLVFFRAASEWRNVQMVELPKGDWAFTMLRQYLFDSYELELLARLAKSSDATIAEIATLARREELYHYRHTSAWVRRLGLGTEESHTRMQRALDELWLYAPQLFQPQTDETTLVEAAVLASMSKVRQAWLERVVPLLAESGLSVSELGTHDAPRTEHTPHLDALLEDMQRVARLDPQAEW